jgi:uncharacterized protein
MSRALRRDRRPDPRRRAFWVKHLYRWHWISSAACLIGMLLFTVTGITLNHAAQIEARPRVTSREGQLPAPLLAELTSRARTGPVPARVGDWIRRELSVSVADREAEWSVDEVYVALPRPGGDAWLSIDLADGNARYERTDRGWISYLNDLHKGRHTGQAWSWFIDVFGVACLVFCATGLVLLQFHARGRPITWPMVGLGLVIPLILAILFIH